MPAPLPTAAVARAMSRAPLSPGLAALMLALLLGLQPVTTDLMLTALPALVIVGIGKPACWRTVETLLEQSRPTECPPAICRSGVPPQQ